MFIFLPIARPQRCYLNDLMQYRCCQDNEINSRLRIQSTFIQNEQSAEALLGKKNDFILYAEYSLIVLGVAYLERRICHISKIELFRARSCRMKEEA